MSQNKNIIFTTLAMNQTIFFVGLAKKLKNRGYNVSIISFHENSCDYIQKNNIEYFNIFKYKNMVDTNVFKEFSRYMDLYKVKNPNLILSHEKIAFNIYETEHIMRKYCNYFYALEQIFKDISKKENQEIIIFQELGGFSSILSTYYFALKNNINNIFIEPSFFRGRVFFVKNSLKSINIFYDKSTMIKAEMEEYLKNTINNKKIVIPSKDKRGYRNPINKILNLYNLKRLIQKSYSKIFLKKNEEFSHIGNHVKRHMKMLINQILLKKYYKDIPNEKFIYFPMHVPNDVALTVRSPEYLDQLSLVYYVVRNLPLGYKIAIKEHPAMLGDIERSRIIKLMKMDKNIILLKPNLNNFDVLKKASLIITINSKAGAEAILNNKKVIVLGDAFYDKCPFVNKVDCLEKLYSTMCNLIDNTEYNQKSDIKKYFQNIWNKSYVGDLYYNKNKNFEKFTESLIKYMEINI